MHDSSQPNGGKVLSRRRFLTAAGAAGAALAAAQVPFATGRPAPPRLTGYPFTLGVASGDPASDGAVLWTRLAPAPLSGGGMPEQPFPVRWELATDEGFRRIVRRGEELAWPEEAHSLHVELRGLDAGREYFYRFIAGGDASPLGRTKTAPGRSAAALAFAFASCQQYEHGYYTAYRHMAQEDLDLVVHLGDYIYEYGTNEYTSAGGNVRAHSSREIVDLGDYRNRHAQYKTDPDLQAAHAAFPWLVTFDDHEVDNNWADEIPEDGQPHDAFIRRRMAAFRAYWEHMPLPRSARPSGSDISLFRRGAFGDLATFHVLDTRQFRSDQPCDDRFGTNCDARLDPARSITGAAQERWLFDGLARSRGTWNVIAQQVFMAQQDFVPGPSEGFNPDAWDGYVASRNRLLGFIDERDIANPMVITGDVHANWAADLKADFGDPDSRTLGSELVGTSIATSGDGVDTTPSNQAVLAENPHIKFNNVQRGYVRCSLDHDRWQTDFRVVPYVKRPGAPISTRASFVVEAGNPGLQPV